MLTGTGAFASRLQRLKAFGTWSSAAAGAMPRAMPMHGRRLGDPLLRAPGEADRRDRAPDDLAAAPGRAAGAAGQALHHHRQARRDRACLRRHGQGPAGARASARPTSTARTWRRASSSSRISAPSPSPTGRPDPGALCGGDAASRQAPRPDPAAGAARGGGDRASDPALRSRSAADRGGAAARLVRAAHHRHAALRLGPGGIRQSLDRDPGRDLRPRRPPGPCATTTPPT